MEAALHSMVADRGLKAALLAGGAILVLVSGDEHVWRRVLGLSLIVCAHFCP
jgi:hypothetical protein